FYSCGSIRLTSKTGEAPTVTLVPSTGVTLPKMSYWATAWRVPGMANCTVADGFQTISPWLTPGWDGLLCSSADGPKASPATRGARPVHVNAICHVPEASMVAPLSE